MIRGFDGELKQVSSDGSLLVQVPPELIAELDTQVGSPLELQLRASPGVMRPKSLSASAALKFELCEAGYRADYIDRVPEIGGSAGLLGSACHHALQFWIESGQYLKFQDQDFVVRQKAMAVVWEMAYWEYFSDQSRYKDGWEMLLRYINREDFSSRTVMEVEIKKHFMLPTSLGDLQVNYILDRKDRLDNGQIEVVDYKTVARPVQAEDMKGRIQPRLYALAMFIEHKALGEELEGVWVTYDLLRYTPVSIFFTREDCIATWQYLKNLAERIYVSEGVIETLNPECRFCTRKQVCHALRRHSDHGGPLTVTSLEEATDRLAHLQNAKGGLDAAIEELAAITLEFAEKEEEMEWTTDLTEAKVTAKGRREVDSGMIASIIGPDIMVRYGNLTVALVEKILKEENLTDNQKSQIKQYITKKWGKPYVAVKPKSAIEE